MKELIPHPARRPLEIEPGFVVTDLSSAKQCDEARQFLTDAILMIEGQLSAASQCVRDGSRPYDPEWERRARGALRAKRAALAEVRIIRENFLRNDQAARDARLLAALRQTMPETVARIEWNLVNV